MIHISYILIAYFKNNSFKIIKLSESCDYLFQIYKTISVIASANGLRNYDLYIPLKFNHRWKIRMNLVEDIRMDLSKPLLRVKTYENVNITIKSLIYYGSLYIYRYIYILNNYLYSREWFLQKIFSSVRGALKISIFFIYNMPNIGLRICLKCKVNYILNMIN